MRDPTHGALRHVPVDAADEAQILVVLPDLVGGLADDDLVVIAIPLVHHVELVEHASYSTLVVRVLALLQHEHHVTPARHEVAGLLREVIGELADQPLQVLGHLPSLPRELPHVEAHEHEVLATCVAVVQVVLHRAHVVGAERRVVGIGVHRVHDRDEGQQEGRRREGRLSTQALDEQQGEGDGQRAEESPHDAMVEVMAHPGQKHREDGAEGDEAQEEDAALLERHRIAPHDEGGPLHRRQHLTGDEREQRRVREQEVSSLVLVVGDLAHVGDIVDEQEVQQGVVAAPEPVGENLRRRHRRQHVERHVRPGGREHQGHHQQKQPGLALPAEIGEGDQDGHNETDGGDDDVRRRGVVGELDVMAHDTTPPLWSRPSGRNSRQGQGHRMAPRVRGRMGCAMASPPSETHPRPTPLGRDAISEEAETKSLPTACHPLSPQGTPCPPNNETRRHPNTQNAQCRYENW